MDMRQLVGRNFARLRAASGLTQEQLAERCGVSQQYISGLEKGKRNPTIVTLYVIAQGLGVSHVELVREDRGSEEGAGSSHPADSPVDARVTFTARSDRWASASPRTRPKT